MNDKKIVKNGRYYSLGALVYQITKNEEGALIAQGYLPEKGFFEANRWEIMLAGESISEKEFREFIAWQDAEYLKECKKKTR